MAEMEFKECRRENAVFRYGGSIDFSERLRKRGFQEDTSEGAPLCRWRQKTTTLDVMPLDAKILGFSNIWYRPAMDHSEELGHAGIFLRFETRSLCGPMILYHAASNEIRCEIRSARFSHSASESEVMDLALGWEFSSLFTHSRKGS